MLYLSKPRRIYLYLGIVDFRKQINGLSSLVEIEFPGGCLQDSWFVFIARNNKQVRILYWRGAGLCLWQYRLTSDRFILETPRPQRKDIIKPSDLERFLSGQNIFAGEKHELKKPKRHS